MNYKILKVFYWSAFSLVAIVMVLACAAICAFGATIEGPESVQIGQLATYTTDIEGDAILVPSKGIALAKDSNRKTFYVASQLDGEYTLIFFGVEDGTPVITQRALTVGEVTPEPQPSPTPEINLTDAEREAASEAFQSVLEGITAGTIRTPQGARATFKATLVEKVGTCSGGVCKLSDGLTAALEDLEKSMDLTTLDGMKTGFEKALEEWK